MMLVYTLEPFGPARVVAAREMVVGVAPLLGEVAPGDGGGGGARGRGDGAGGVVEGGGGGGGEVRSYRGAPVDDGAEDVGEEGFGGLSEGHGVVRRWAGCWVGGCSVVLVGGGERGDLGVCVGVEGLAGGR